VKTGFKILAVTLVAAVLLTFGFVGYVALAQQPPPQDQGALQQFFWEALAGKLGLDAQKVQDYVVAAAKEAVSRGQQEGKLTQAQADQINKLLDNQGAGAAFALGRLAERQRLAAAWLGRNVALDAAAKTLGMTTEELQAELKAGKTLGQVADAKGVSRDTLVEAMKDAMKQAVDQAVQNGRITQDQADKAKARIDEQKIDLDKVPGANRPGVNLGSGRKVALDAAAKALGMTTDELQAELKAGKTLGQIADAKGVSRDTLVEALKDSLKIDLDKPFRPQPPAKPTP
jgi:lambda repressor-like predicted transcriptional regulator